MGENSKIEWCDMTFNPWIGCSKVSPGCKNCYAENQMDHRFGKVQWGPGKPRQRTSAANWRKVLQWNREAGSEAFHADMHRDITGQPMFKAHRPRVFCASLADWLDPEVPIDWLADLLDLIRKTPHLDWLLLTKRPELWAERIFAGVYTDLEAHGGHHQLANWVSDWINGTPPTNVWIGTSVEDQTRADERIPVLAKIPAKVRFLSCEPMLGPVDLSKWLECPWLEPSEFFHWVICGGESGPHARPMHPNWTRSLRDQCKAAGVPFLFKQWGEWVPWEYDQMMHVHRSQAEKVIDTGAWHDPLNPPNGWDCCLETGVWFQRVGKKAAGRLLDGVEHSEFPEVQHA